MLEELVVEGLGAIDRAEIDLGDGLSALTGETGAGKTLLVAALGLLMGQRADRSLVREGAEAAVVEGRFSLAPDHPAAALIADDPSAAGDAPLEVVLSRTIPADGRAGKARINGRVATTAAVAELGSVLVEIAGQHHSQRLNDPGVQRALIDSFAGAEAESLAGEVRALVGEMRRIERELAEVESTTREREREIDVLRFEVDEIESAGVIEGETERLQQQAARLEHATSIAEGLAAAVAALKDEGGALETIGSALRSLEAAASLDPSLAETVERLQGIVYDLTDAADSVAAEEVSVDPAALEQSRERLSQLARLKRKYGEDETAVLAYLERSRRRLESLDDPTAAIERLRGEAQEARARAAKAAGRLSELRSAAAAALESAIEPLLAELALPGARFEVALQDCDLYEGGGERVELRVAANPGETPRAVAKVASGGELSRIALALHVLTGTATVGTLVFDEVDAGVGGEAALAVGRSLGRLAIERNAQVLVVTHLPQVAAFADHQYRVLKTEAGGRASVDVKRVGGDDRVEELSRMLAGMPESDKARQHAQELLQIAGRTR